MCLQSLMSSTPPFLGTNAKKVAFKLLSNVPDLWKSFKNQNTQPWTVDPKLRNKTMVNLSGPKLYPCLNQVMLLAALLHWKDPLDPLYPPPPAVWKAPFLHQGDGPLCLKEAIGNIQKSISSILTPKCPLPPPPPLYPDRLSWWNFINFFEELMILNRGICSHPVIHQQPALSSFKYQYLICS